ncbi:hypothetical protein K505DRAFT_166210 [Melanomma pulvis-pyrius CBS 109.77]|uniref:Uncharacterized protein n=1 Tax=Melanomma pulvis-pyrius CBS 109.77 TaxID=1314802 RepID=A0A6A6XIK3_9PLEO|nr:hypothetical protein K505DRAFT_166210 [Melanomma pulvis-pyrius CBS 109.77]
MRQKVVPRDAKEACLWLMGLLHSACHQMYRRATAPNGRTRCLLSVDSLSPRWHSFPFPGLRLSLGMGSATPAAEGAYSCFYAVHRLSHGAVHGVAGLGGWNGRRLVLRVSSLAGKWHGRAQAAFYLVLSASTGSGFCRGR